MEREALEGVGVTPSRKGAFLQSVISDIRFIFDDVPCLERSDLHNRLQKEISDLSLFYNLVGCIEVWVPGFSRKTKAGVKVGRVDVVWYLDSIPVVAFEIDSSYREKSITKLSHFNSLHKIWVVYSTSRSRPFIPNEITLIHLKYEGGRQ